MSIYTQVLRFCKNIFFLNSYQFYAGNSQTKIFFVFQVLEASQNQKLFSWQGNFYLWLKSIFSPIVLVDGFWGLFERWLFGELLRRRRQGGRLLARRSLQQRRQHAGCGTLWFGKKTLSLLILSFLRKKNLYTTFYWNKKRGVFLIEN